MTVGALSVAWRRVGVLGGMGPAATVDFYAKLVEATGATRDQEHLPVVVWADPAVPDRSDHLLGTGPDPRPALRTGIRHLVGAGCEVLAVPCNTAHAFVTDLARDEGIELVHLIEAVADELAAAAHLRAGVLATTGTVGSRLYDDALASRGIETLTPCAGRQDVVMRTIRAVKAGRVGARETADLTEVVLQLAARGADVVVAGCTEIVLAAGTGPMPVPVIDPARALARSVVLRARRAADQPAT